jgi:hypothetical protein
MSKRPAPKPAQGESASEQGQGKFARDHKIISNRVITQPLRQVARYRTRWERYRVAGVCRSYRPAK